MLAQSTLAGPSLYLEKPVTPQRYLRGISQILGIALPEAGPDPESLRRETRRLLDEADPGTLEEVLKTLQKTGR